jgi:hypothetical protein
MKALKNMWGKTVKKDKAYFVGHPSANWTQYVLKVYGDPRKPFARAFVLAVTPFTPEGEMGDVYAADVPGLTEAWVKAHVEGN